ncbi:MAG: DUF4328 domain-containing protein [Polyangia bacterium]
MSGYVSARPRAQLVDVLLAAQIALYALRVAGGVVVAVAPDGELGRMLERGARLSVPFLLVLFIAATIALLFWLDRAARNLPSLGARTTIAPEHVVGVFFAPLVNLAAVPYVLRHVWLASDPTPPRRGWLVAGWWATLLLAGAGGLWASAFGAALMLASAACLLGIVRDTQRRQDEQILDEELRRAVPLPTADALR